MSSFGAAAGFGPIRGGALTDRLSWRWCSWINIPVGAVAVLIVFIFLKLEDTDNTDRKLSVKKKLQHLDPFGVCLLLGSVCCIVLALQWGGSKFLWRSAKIISLFIGYGLLGVFKNIIDIRAIATIGLFIHEVIAKYGECFLIQDGAPSYNTWQ